MKFDFKLVFLIFIIFFSLNIFSVSAAISGVCCYEAGGDGDITPVFKTTCGSSSILLGSATLEDCLSVPGQGSTIDSQRLGCYDSFGKCYGTVLGRKLYNYGEIKDYFKNILKVDLEKICNAQGGGLKPYTTACSSDFKSTGVSSGYNSGSSGNSGVQVGTGDNALNYSALSKYRENETQKFCYDAGGPFGYFLTENSCNSLSNDGEIFPCLYNPFRAGYIGSTSANDILGFNILESGCVPKSAIKNCFDYKTQENCVDNVISNDPKNELYKTRNLNECSWFDISEYFGSGVSSGGFFDVGNGVCLSSEVSYSKHFNVDKYYNRLNLLKNPGFEDGGVNWQGSLEIIESEYSYDGSHYAKLSANSQVSQVVKKIGDNYYNFFLYVREDEFSSTDKITITLIEYDVLNVEIDKNEFTFDLSSISSPTSSGVFRKVVFNQGGHKFSKGVDSIKFIISSNTEISFDSVNLEFYDSLRITTDTNFFKPLEIIPIGASSCELCFDKDNFNTCTQKKSDLLGDCSYMIPNITASYDYTKIGVGAKYLGKDENIYLNNSWQSQSIANSALFCEMYLNEDLCEDPNNYVNFNFKKFHTQSEIVLCRWNKDYGCFKDSDNSLGPDTISGGYPYLKRYEPLNLDKKGFTNLDFSAYYFKGNSSGFSDFAYSCDVLPPQTYLYFVGKNSSKGVVELSENFPTQTLGDIWININSYDISLESCNPYNIDDKKRIYVDFVVNNLTNYVYSDGSLFDINSPIKDLFVDENSNSLFKQDGKNNLTIIVKDQSGNIGKVFDYKIDIDVNGPEINVLDPVLIDGNFIGPLVRDQSLLLEIKDYSKVESCEFNLDVIDAFLTDSSKKVDSSYYDSYGKMNLTNISEGADKYRFKIPIYNTTSNANYYVLSFTCSDIFGQNSTKDYFLAVDYDTSFVLVNPLGFFDYLGNNGFINSQKTFNGVSTDKNLISCEFDFKGTDGISGPLVLTNVPLGFSNYRFSPSVKFYQNITGTIDFATNGIKDIAVKCSDNLGNNHIEDIRYYYDKIAPTFIDFEIVDSSLNAKTVVKIDGKYYVRKADRALTYLNTILSINLDGTISWISTNNDDYNLKYFNGSSYFNVTNSVTFNYELEEDSSVGNILISNYNDLILYGGILTNEKNLFLQKYQLNFKDKASNSNQVDIEYYFDDSRPGFVFSGEIYQDNKNLYTRSSNPNIVMNFNTPEYRKFSCSYELLWQGVKLREEGFAYGPQIEFKLSDIAPSVNLENDKLNVEFTCVDEYGVVLKDKFVISYDNTKPVLKKIYLEDGNNIYFPNGGKNTVFDNLKDSLMFEFEDTKEVGYRCEYSFSENFDYYLCNNSVSKINFDGANKYVFKTPSELEILSDLRSSICNRDRTLINPILSDYHSNDMTLKTNIKVDAKCFDKVNLSTDIVSTNIFVSYVAGNKFVDFDIDYSLDEAQFKVTSLQKFDSVVVSYDNAGSQVITILTGGDVLVEGLYVYTGSASISEIGEQVNRLWAVGFGTGGSIWDSISSSFIIDKIAPEIELIIPDSNEKGEVFFEDFQVLFNVFDEGESKLSFVDFYINDKLVFSANNPSNYSKTNLFDIDLTKNRYTFDKGSYFGNLGVKGYVGQTYNIKIITEDGYGNQVQVEKTIIVKNGLGIRLLDSSNSKVGYDRFSWITKTNAPILKFETSKEVVRCSVLPFATDKEWIKITQNPSIVVQEEVIPIDGAIDKKFEFNLISFENYDLSKISDLETSVLIKCIYNGTTYNFTRGVEFYNKLPDYVLKSSNGFILGSFPYESVLNVRSVGPNKYITCSYSIDSSDFIEFTQGQGVQFDEKINMDNKLSGVHSLELKCLDILGTVGPTKHYEFIVDKNSKVEIKDVELNFGNERYGIVNDNKIYISKKNDLNLNFVSNKKGLTCSYDITGSGFVNVAISFVKSLFVNYKVDLSSDDSGHLFSAKGLKFNDDNLLKIFCTGLTEPIKYNVIYLNSSSLEFDLVR